MYVPRFYSQEEYEQFKIELDQFINKQTSPDYWSYNYYIGAKYDMNSVGSHKDGFTWLDNNNEIDEEYRLNNTFEQWRTGWSWINGPFKMGKCAKMILPIK